MPAGATYDSINTTTLSSNSLQVDFNSIPGSYTDLVFVYDGSVTGGATSLRFRVNGNSSTLYSNMRIYGDGATASSARDSNYNIGIFGFMLNNKRQNVQAHLMNYSNTSVFKTTINRDSSEDYVFLWTNIWRSTSAISSLSLFTDNNSIFFTAGSTFSLYGITAA